MKKSETATCTLGTVSREDDIVRLVLVDSDAHELADARSLMQAIRKVIARTDPRPMLTDVRETSVGPSKEARAFYDDPENGGYVTCSALLCASAYQKILGNFAFLFSPHDVPRRIFTDEASALEWLRKNHAAH